MAISRYVQAWRALRDCIYAPHSDLGYDGHLPSQLQKPQKLLNALREAAKGFDREAPACLKAKFTHDVRHHGPQRRDHNPSLNYFR